MTAFRIRIVARDWFKDLRRDRKLGLSTDFDALYFCFIAGIAASRKLEAPQSETAELVDYFPDRFRTRGAHLVALFISSEVKRIGVNPSDKRQLHRTISQYVDPNSQSRLSDSGVREFCGYANGGFDVLSTEWFEDRPRDLGAFLVGFAKQVGVEAARAPWLVPFASN
jgi:hypothetical protein